MNAYFGSTPVFAQPSNPPFPIDDTLSRDEMNVLGVSRPVKFLSQEDYDALTEEEKVNRTVYATPQQPYLPMTDNGAVPTGAVISFLGLKAPVGYLICDGAEHEITKYPRLAKFIEYQFEVVSFFGGDGIETFAVPNMSDLFLRGYNPDEDGLSGEIGVKQEGTYNTRVTGTVGIGITTGGVVECGPQNVDSNIGAITSTCGVAFNAPYENYGLTTWYTSRPVNMAVLYCIKY